MVLASEEKRKKVLSAETAYHPNNCGITKDPDVKIY
jgi:hypothetical protein